MTMDYEKKQNRILEKRFKDLDHLCNQQVNALWKNYEEKEGRKQTYVRQGIMGKILGIKWVLERVKELERRDDKIF